MTSQTSKYNLMGYFATPKDTEIKGQGYAPKPNIYICFSKNNKPLSY